MRTGCGSNSMGGHASWSSTSSTSSSPSFLSVFSPLWACACPRCAGTPTFTGPPRHARSTESTRWGLGCSLHSPQRQRHAVPCHMLSHAAILPTLSALHTNALPCSPFAPAPGGRHGAARRRRAGAAGRGAGGRARRGLPPGAASTRGAACDGHVKLPAASRCKGKAVVWHEKGMRHTKCCKP